MFEWAERSCCLQGSGAEAIVVREAEALWLAVVAVALAGRSGVPSVAVEGSGRRRRNGVVEAAWGSERRVAALRWGRCA